MISKAEVKLVKKLMRTPSKRDLSRLVAIVSKDGRLTQAVKLLITARHDGLFNDSEFHNAIIKIHKWPSVETALLCCIEMGDTEQWKPLACIYADSGRLNQALNACEEYLSRHVSLSVEVAQASVLANLGRYKEARTMLGYLMKEKRQTVRDKAICDLAFIEARDGNKDRAMELVATVNNPPVESAHQWGMLMKMNGKHKVAIAKMRSALKSRMTTNLRKKILFSMGAILDDMGDYEAAYAVFKGGNKLKDVNYNRKRETKTLAGMKEIFNKKDFAKTLKAASACSEVQPVFVVGMPRSGTSLTEQILSSHSKIEGKGELSCAGKTTFVCDELTKLTAGELQECRDNYLKCAGVESGCFTDKMPANYAMIGSLALMFPGAKFINVQRGEDDLAVAIWVTDFAQPHRYAYDVGDIRFKTKAYQEYIEHWKSIGIDILDVRYEDVVRDTEKTVDRIFDYIGMDVEEPCYSPHISTRVVQTASWEQVRQPIHSKSVGRAKNYPKLF